jgi:lysophospholipase L1-like esterase
MFLRIACAQEIAAPPASLQSVRDLLARPEGVRWLFYGDSITMGSAYTEGCRDYTQLFAERVRFELRRKKDVVLNTAVSGDNTARLLDGFDARVRPFQPHVVFLMAGMNDCVVGDAKRSVPPEAFRANLKALARRVREISGCLLVFQTTCPILPGTAPEREAQFGAYMDLIRAAAAEEKAPLIDHTRHWLDTLRRDPPAHARWMGHAFHPNQFGHRAFARLIFHEMGMEDPQSATCRLPIP